MQLLPCSSMEIVASEYYMKVPNWGISSEKQAIDLDGYVWKSEFKHKSWKTLV